MRKLEVRTLTITAGTSQAIDCRAAGAQSAIVQLSNTIPDAPVYIFDELGALSQRVASCFPGADDPDAGSYLWTPVINGSLRIQNTSTGVVTATVTLYDEPNTNPDGRFICEVDGVIIGAGATDVGRFVFPGRFNQLELVVSVSQEATIHLDVYITAIFGFFDYQVTQIAATAGGVASFVVPMPFARWQLRVVNDDGANPNTLGVIAYSTGL
jgi:hypothetical protein